MRLDEIKMKMKNKSHKYGIHRLVLDLDANIVNVKSVHCDDDAYIY